MEVYKILMNLFSDFRISDLRQALFYELIYSVQ